MQFRIQIDIPELAVLDQIGDIVAVGAWLGEKGVRQFEHLLEIAVPRSKLRCGVEHDDAVAHVVEGYAQFSLTLRQLVGSFFDEPFKAGRGFGPFGK